MNTYYLIIFLSRATYKFLSHLPRLVSSVFSSHSDFSNSIKMAMGTMKLQFPHLGISQNRQKHTFKNNPMRVYMGCCQISCGLRNMGPKKPMWRSRVLSTEAIQAVQSLKLAANSPSKLDQLLKTKLTRLLKADLLDTLTELQRQNQLHLALKVFDFVRKESWYTPDISLYYDMILLLGKNKLIQKAEDLFDELKKEGFQPDTRAYTELIGAYFQVDMVDKAMETYNLMKASGCAPDKLTLMIMVRNLEKVGKEDLAASVKKDFEEYVDDPEKFLEEVERKYARDPLFT